MPDWVAAGYREYARRMPRECDLRLAEISPHRRTRGSDAARARTVEGERILSAVPGSARLVALDRGGRQWSTEQLALELEGWLSSGEDVALMIGGPDGLSTECLDAARQRWSLSELTLPHPLVRVVVAEQLYRAWSILRNHPYHR